MKTDWKNELKKILKKQDMSKNGTAINCEKGLNAVNRSSVLKEIRKKSCFSPKCSNCELAMGLTKNNTLWFCELGCGSMPNN